MRKIYENAKAVLIWIGPDDGNDSSSLAFDSIRQITARLSEKLHMSLDEMKSKEELYQGVIFENQQSVPRPDEFEFMTPQRWQALLWLYKYPYFTRVWAIQEINANKERVAYCGTQTVDWTLVELIAGYIIFQSSLCSDIDFSSAFCWWASTAPSELRQAQNWLHMLYLASNFGATDPRDLLYGLRGMIDCREGGHLLDPDYSKTIIDVYRDSVEASLMDYKNTNALQYVSGAEDPSWVPRWDKPMLFRNPFRFGKAVPWKAAGDSLPSWSIDKKSNVLALSGYIIDSVQISETYKESYFGNTMVDSEQGKLELEDIWQRVLKTMATVFPTPFESEVLISAASSLSYGIDQKCNPADENVLYRNFVAYLKIVLDEKIFHSYISETIFDECKDGDGSVFGKPVWDFEYPPASLFITENKIIGCAIATTQPGDIVFAPLGCSYPLVLRADDSGYRVRGFCFVHGYMLGEGARQREVVVVDLH